MSTEHQQTTRPALITFGNRWELDGDYIRCRGCRRPQIVSMVLHDFHHAAGCSGAEHEQNPWKTLASLINAHVVKAEEPANAN